ncbi:MAG: PBECR2 nuclease fold domain-containing protein [Gammaproteobacteria bacterium]
MRDLTLSTLDPEYTPRTRFIKAYKLNGGRFLLIVFDQQDGVMLSWTFFHGKNWRHLNDQRNGLLWWGE